VDILVGTPLLAGKLIKSERLQLAAAHFLVLDEGDRLLDEQFVEQVDAVLAACTNPHLVCDCAALLDANASNAAVVDHSACTCSSASL
jgi:ATP-dependent RNA helicase DDX52/ROK1